MEKRINIKNLEPKAYKAMLALEKYLSGSEVSKKILDLVKIRASQINGCAYCLDMHASEALDRGETQKRIFALSAWRESPLFSVEERVVLQMTEEISLISENGLSSLTYKCATKYFVDNQVAQLIMQIGTINMWNRIAVSTQLVQDR